MSQSNQPPSQNPYSSPVQPTQTPAYLNQPGMQGDKAGGIIPYKNPHALIGYYLGIVGLLPVLGIPFGIAAIVLGIIGLRKRAANPIIKGSAHAVIAICCGALSLLCGGVFGAGIVAALFSANS
jgi:hypothetical protein